MSHTLMVVPTGLGAGLTTAVLGLFHAMDRQGIKVHFFKPLSQLAAGEEGVDRSVAMLQQYCDDPVGEPVTMRHAEHLVSEGRGDELLEEIVARYEQSTPSDCEVVIIEGMVPTRNQPYATRINKEIARALDAEVVLVAAPGNDTPESLEDHIDITARAYGGIDNPKVVGCILNKLGAPTDRDGRPRPDVIAENPVAHSITAEVVREHCSIFNDSFRLLGCIPWEPMMMAPRVLDIADYLNATVLSQGDMLNRRVMRFTLCARTVANTVGAFKAGTLVFTPGDRDDVLMATALAAQNGVDLAALVLTGGYEPDPQIMKLCAGAVAKGLPILSVPTDSWQTALLMPRFNQEIPVDDVERIAQVKEITASNLDNEWLGRFRDPGHERRLSPPAFRYQLIERARQANRIIVLPEGNEPRTIKAAAICAERGIARCTLLGNEEEIRRIAKGHGVKLGEGVEIFDPEQIRSHYVGTHGAPSHGGAQSSTEASDRRHGQCGASQLRRHNPEWLVRDVTAEGGSSSTAGARNGGATALI